MKEWRRLRGDPAQLLNDGFARLCTMQTPDATTDTPLTYEALAHSLETIKKAACGARFNKISQIVSQEEFKEMERELKSNT